MRLPSKTLERNLFKSGYRLIYAIDEVGMGCLAGPVVVCAVAVTNQFYKKAHKKLRGLRESKLLSTTQREFYAQELLKEKDLVHVLTCSYPKTIDKLNIYNVARQAMKRAVKKLTMGTIADPTMVPIVLVDGKAKIKDLNIEQMAIVKGDRKVFAIACASIIAKVYRDKMMVRYAQKYPNYGFEKHKGYGTKYHQIQLTTLGPCEIHRKSFAPVAKLL
jgi:ribonuclease HII